MSLTRTVSNQLSITSYEGFQIWMLNAYVQQCKSDAPILSAKSSKTVQVCTFKDVVEQNEARQISVNLRNLQNLLTPTKAVLSLSDWNKKKLGMVTRKCYKNGRGYHIITTTTLDIEPIEFLV